MTHQGQAAWRFVSRELAKLKANRQRDMVLAYVFGFLSATAIGIWTWVLGIVLATEGVLERVLWGG